MQVWAGEHYLPPFSRHYHPLAGTTTKNSAKASMKRREQRVRINPHPLTSKCLCVSVGLLVQLLCLRLQSGIRFKKLESLISTHSHSFTNITHESTKRKREQRRRTRNL